MIANGFALFLFKIRATLLPQATAQVPRQGRKTSADLPAADELSQLIVALAHEVATNVSEEVKVAGQDGDDDAEVGHELIEGLNDRFAEIPHGGAGCAEEIGDP